jgi:hypothetical protein
MVRFRDTTESGEPVTRRIRRILEGRHAMHIGELCMRLGWERPTVEERLQTMVECGDVERLRPIGYAREDHDFFRVANRKLTRHSQWPNVPVR